MANRFNFTPLIDNLPDYLDIFSVAILGFIWRYEQLSQQKCFTTIATMAKATRMSRRSVIRKIKMLVEEGWIIDLTPDRRNAPHEYITSEKFRIYLEDKLDIPSVPESHSDGSNPQNGKTHCHSATTKRQSWVTVSQAQGAPESVEDTNKISIKRQRGKIEVKSSTASKALGRVKGILRPDILKNVYDLYIDGLVARGIENGNLVIETDDETKQIWLQSNAAVTMNNHLKGILPDQKIEVLFVVDDNEQV